MYQLYKCNNAKKFVWTEECGHAFKVAKEALKRITVNLDPLKSIILTCDTGPRGRNAYISQPYDDGQKPVAFGSKRLSKAQENYLQIDKGRGKL